MPRDRALHIEVSAALGKVDQSTQMSDDTIKDGATHAAPQFLHAQCSTAVASYREKASNSASVMSRQSTWLYWRTAFIHDVRQVSNACEVRR